MKAVCFVSIILLFALFPLTAWSQETSSLQPTIFVAEEYFLRKWVSEKVQPEYPAEAQTAGIQGTVLVFVVFNREGKVDEVKPLASPHGLLSEAVIKAVKLWRISLHSKFAPDAITFGELRFIFSLNEGIPEVSEAPVDVQKKPSRESDAERTRRRKLRSQQHND